MKTENEELLRLLFIILGIGLCVVFLLPTCESASCLCLSIMGPLVLLRCSKVDYEVQLGDCINLLGGALVSFAVYICAPFSFFTRSFMNFVAVSGVTQYHAAAACAAVGLLLMYLASSSMKLSSPAMPRDVSVLCGALCLISPLLQFCLNTAYSTHSKVISELNVGVACLLVAAGMQVFNFETLPPLSRPALLALVGIPLAVFVSFLVFFFL